MKTMTEKQKINVARLIACLVLILSLLLGMIACSEDDDPVAEADKMENISPIYSGGYDFVENEGVVFFFVVADDIQFVFDGKTHESNIYHLNGDTCLFSYEQSKKGRVFNVRGNGIKLFEVDNVNAGNITLVKARGDADPNPSMRFMQYNYKSIYHYERIILWKGDNIYDFEDNLKDQ